METRNGYARTVWGKVTDDGRNVVSVKLGDAVVFELEDVEIQIPVTDEAAQYAFRAYTFAVTEPDGTVHNSSGLLSAAQAKYMHGIESPRGAIRALASKLQKQGKTVPEIRAILATRADEFRASFERFDSVGGGESAGVAKVKPLTDEEFDRAVKDGTIKQLLQARGMM